MLHEPQGHWGCAWWKTRGRLHGYISRSIVVDAPSAASLHMTQRIYMINIWSISTSAISRVDIGSMNINQARKLLLAHCVTELLSHACVQDFTITSCYLRVWKSYSSFISSSNQCFTSSLAERVSAALLWNHVNSLQRLLYLSLNSEVLVWSFRQRKRVQSVLIQYICGNTGEENGDKVHSLHSSLGKMILTCIACHRHCGNMLKLSLTRSERRHSICTVAAASKYCWCREYSAPGGFLKCWSTFACHIPTWSWSVCDFIPWHVNAACSS